MFSCEFCKIYQNSFFIEHLEAAGNILKSQALYRSLLIGNFHQFMFIFFKESFSMSFQGLLFVIHCIGPKTLRVTSWISQGAKIKSVTESYSYNYRKYLSEKDFGIDSYHFGSSQRLVSLKIKTAVSLIRGTWAIIPIN